MVKLFYFFKVIFDSDPAPAGVAPNAQMEQMGQAMIRFCRKRGDHNIRCEHFLLPGV